MSLETPEPLVHIPSAGEILEANLSSSRLLSRGIVVFAHGSSSSRHSPRNRFVAGELRHAGLATLLVDLLTQREEERDEFDARFRFDVGFLADRIIGVVDWLRGNPETARLPIGLFGASTGAAAALVAAADRAREVKAVVSRGGRPDLAMEVLGRVRAATLLIVGSADEDVVELNRRAFAKLRCEKRLSVVPGAGHLFEEPGALDSVARLAAEWFGRNLSIFGVSDTPPAWPGAVGGF